MYVPFYLHPNNVDIYESDLMLVMQRQGDNLIHHLGSNPANGIGKEFALPTRRSRARSGRSRRRARPSGAPATVRYRRAGGLARPVQVDAREIALERTFLKNSLITILR
jgi:hypothetical protein